VARLLALHAERLAAIEGGERPPLIGFSDIRALPEAHIRCVEMPGRRANVWAEWCERNKVDLVKPELGPAYVAAGQADQAWDIIYVGGEMQDECTAAAQALLAEACPEQGRRGGQVIVNPSADLHQICDDDRDADASVVAAYECARDKAAAPTLTVVLLNWRRPENIGQVLNCLTGQAKHVSLQVWVWNNGERIVLYPDLTALADGRHEGEVSAVRDGQQVPERALTWHPLVTRVIDGAPNLGCLPRWSLAAYAESEFICSLDDDVLFTDDRVLADAVEACRTRCADGIVGFTGWQHVDGKTYKDARHVNGPEAGDGGAFRDVPVDVVKGRFMLMRRELLSRVPMLPPAWPSQAGSPGRPAPGADDEPLGRRCDDIYVSLCVAGGAWGKHLIPAEIARRWKNIDAADALESQAGHYERRDRAIRVVREWLQSRRPSDRPDLLDPSLAPRSAPAHTPVAPGVPPGEEGAAA